MSPRFPQTMAKDRFLRQRKTRVHLQKEQKKKREKNKEAGV